MAGAFLAILMLAGTPHADAPAELVGGSALELYRALEPPCPAAGFAGSREVELVRMGLAEWRNALAGTAILAEIDSARIQILRERAERHFECAERIPQEEARALDAEIIRLDNAMTNFNNIVLYLRQEG